MNSSIVFYNKFATSYNGYSEKRRSYLSAVDSYILADADKQAKNLLDIGCGDGSRTAKIVQALNMDDVSFLDNSPAMLSLCDKVSIGEKILQDVSDNHFKMDRKFDIILCLWNVLGHIPDADSRKKALENIRAVMTSGSIFYVDVNNRYNAANYGFTAATRNIAEDCFPVRKRRGDFDLNIDGEEGDISTKVHLFSSFEIEKLIKKTGFTILDRKVIDYSTGKYRNLIWEGQLLYKLTIKP